MCQIIRQDIAEYMGDRASVPRPYSPMRGDLLSPRKDIAADTIRHTAATARWNSRGLTHDEGLYLT